MVIENVDWRQVGLYLAVMVPPEEVDRLGLVNVVPKKKGRPGRPRTINYLQDKKNDQKWTVARKPGVRQQKKMLSLAISVGVRMVLANHTYKVGDVNYQQVRGGPIGLELTGAVSRPFMMRWDRLYLQKVKRSGMEMLVYERYADDSNQIAKTPPVGSKYDRNKQKVVYDENELRIDEQEDKRLARILKEIANTVQEGIVMVEDTPSQNSSGKLPILDMEVWMTEEKKVVYRHYEKPMSNRRVMNAKSAQSSSCKKSVHVQELLRRILNTSSRLNWTTTVAPVLTDYMKRMMSAGYHEGYRKSVLGHALRIYERMRQEDQDGVRPLYRPPDWQAEERRIDKRRKRYSWSTKGGFIAPIFVPATPNSELVKMFQQLADEESLPGMKFKIVESGGRSAKGILQKSNPTATPGCGSKKCLACRGERGKGGSCRRGNIQYEICCNLCPDEVKSAYVGETSRNLFARGVEHDRKNLKQRIGNHL